MTQGKYISENTQDIIKRSKKNSWRTLDIENWKQSVHMDNSDNNHDGDNNRDDDNNII